MANLDIDSIEPIKYFNPSIWSDLSILVAMPTHFTRMAVLTLPQFHAGKGFFSSHAATILILCNAAVASSHLVSKWGMIHLNTSTTSLLFPLISSLKSKTSFARKRARLWEKPMIQANIEKANSNAWIEGCGVSSRTLAAGIFYFSRGVSVLWPMACGKISSIVVISRTCCSRSRRD